ncbi:Polysaccharide deacetylase [Marinospirillum celere]|uniref:Polysaccharide deacetylase n=1 Tax=Marinospirillum celere TaxID=1122252 RepID=A0A1I1GWE3_9GAMM|nr:polysaccharide deacetylase family protein [Marinospirillum celere]SFC15815.1 Polysaccharide deacetylase [Marinospirillum celere]
MRQVSLLILLLTGLIWTTQSWAEETPRFHASILMYHHISSSTPPSTSTPSKTFIEHLDMLERDGFEVWPLDRVVERIQRRRPLPDKIAVLTFDDAYISVYETAMPIMEERGLPYTIFVNADPINRDRPLYMSWDQLREAKEKGAIIANHTLNHPHMVRKQEGESQEEWLERMRHEVEENQRQLIDQLGTAPKLFAYPYGEYNPELEKLLRDLGYVAFGQHSGPASPFTSLQALPRYAANGIFANPNTLRTKLHALPFPLTSESPASGVLEAEERRPTLEFTMAEGDYRLNQLRCYGPGAEVLDVRTRRQDDGSVKVTVNTNKALNPGRPRYNCTAPHSAENRWFWFSRQWMLPRRDGSWYEG